MKLGLPSQEGGPSLHGGNEMLTELDLKNILMLLARAQFNGISEAEVAVVLAHKLRKILTPPPPAPPSEDANKE